MYKPVNLTDDVFYVGVNDRRTHLFENMWPIERGVAYNSYVIKDEKIAFRITSYNVCYTKLLRLNILH